jgi:hypothetical protein
MYFQLHNHLDFDNDFNDEFNDKRIKDNVCVVCFDKSNDFLSKLYFKNSENLELQKICCCDCCIHQKCLDPWIYKSQSCPICREKMAAKIILNALQDETLILAVDLRSLIVYNSLRNIKFFFDRLIRVAFIISYFSLVIYLVQSIAVFALVPIKKAIL